MYRFSRTDTLLPSPSCQIIGLSQVKYILGYDIPRSDVIYTNLYNIFANISQFNYETFLMGTGAIALQLIFKRIGRRNPKFKILGALGPMTVTVIGIILVAAFILDEKGIQVDKTIPRGLPTV